MRNPTHTIPHKATGYNTVFIGNWYKEKQMTKIKPHIAANKNNLRFCFKYFNNKFVPLLILYDISGSEFRTNKIRKSCSFQFFS